MFADEMDWPDLPVLIGIFAVLFVIIVLAILVHR